VHAAALALVLPMLITLPAPEKIERKVEVVDVELIPAVQPAPKIDQHVEQTGALPSSPQPEQAAVEETTGQPAGETPEVTPEPAEETVTKPPEEAVAEPADQMVTEPADQVVVEPMSWRFSPQLLQTLLPMSSRRPPPQRRRRSPRLLPRPRPQNLFRLPRPSRSRSLRVCPSRNPSLRARHQCPNLPRPKNLKRQSRRLKQREPRPKRQSLLPRNLPLPRQNRSPSLRIAGPLKMWSRRGWPLQRLMEPAFGRTHPGPGEAIA
jgi:hypothetical protein